MQDLKEVIKPDMRNYVIRGISGPLSLLWLDFMVTDRIRSMGEGNVFRCVCLSIGGVYLWRDGGLEEADPPPCRHLRDRVNRGAVHILLHSCFIVL